VKAYVVLVSGSKPGEAPARGLSIKEGQALSHGASSSMQRRCASPRTPPNPQLNSSIQEGSQGGCGAGARSRRTCGERHQRKREHIPTATTPSPAHGNTGQGWIASAPPLERSVSLPRGGEVDFRLPQCESKRVLLADYLVMHAF
jgi:hypothetical protein